MKLSLGSMPRIDNMTQKYNVKILEDAEPTTIKSCKLVCDVITYSQSYNLIS